MRKITLMLFAFMTSIIANAQISVNENFEDGSYLYELPPDWDATSEDWGFIYYMASVYGGLACEGSYAINGNLYEFMDEVWLETPTYTGANEENITVGFTLQIADYYDEPLDYDWGSVNFQYSTDGGTTWQSLYIIDEDDVTTTCNSFYYTILSSNFDATSQIKFRWDFTWLNEDWMFSIDSFSIVQIPEVAELDCADNLSSVLNTECHNGQAGLTWDEVTGALYYKLYVGTAAGNYDFIDEQIVNGNNYLLTGLSADQTYFWKVVPATTTMEAVACSEESFTTSEVICLCSPVYDEYDEFYYFDYISSVTTTGAITNINNPSTHENFGYSDFRDIELITEPSQAVTFTVNYEYDGNSYITAWVDWNNNNELDESERILPTVLMNGITHQFTYTIPEDAEDGSYTLRIRTAYYYMDEPFAIDPCLNYSYGETEDYTLTIETAADPCDEYTAPNGETTQTIDEGQTLADLVVEGENLTWYADEELTEEVNPAETEPIDGDIFYVTQSNENCVSEPLMITITVLSSLNDVQMANLKVYPNPANDFINVSYTKNIESVTIIDFTGRKVMEKTIRAQEASLHINQLSTGTYLMNIQTTEGSTMIKFIKK